MNGPIAPLSTQIAKQKSKYRNDANSVGPWPDFRKVLKLDMAVWRSMRRAAARSRVRDRVGRRGGCDSPAAGAAGIEGGVRQLEAPGAAALAAASPKRGFVTPRPELRKLRARCAAPRGPLGMTYARAPLPTCMQRLAA